MIPIYTVIYRLYHKKGREIVDFTASPYKDTLQWAENLVNQQLNRQPIPSSCNIKLLFTQQDVLYVHDLLTDYLINHPFIHTTPPDPSVFPISTRDTLSVTVLYDSEDPYDKTQVIRALQKFGHETAGTANFRQFKVNANLFQNIGEIHYVKTTPGGLILPKFDVVVC